MKKLFCLLLAAAMLLSAFAAIAEPATDEVVSDEVVSDEVVSDEVVSDEVVSDEVVSDETAEAEAAEAETSDDGADPGPLQVGGGVTGDFDEPAPTDPEERYEYYVEETDGSEELIFYLLDMMNDEATDIAEHGALYVADHVILDEGGEPSVTILLSIQDSPYGTVIVTRAQIDQEELVSYTINTDTFLYEDGEVEHAEAYTQDTFDFLSSSYHFPYGSLEVMNGVRQDENGYTYFLIRSDAETTFEFVTGDGMRILQLRVYSRNRAGKLELSSWVDYDVGPAWEIPQPVLDAMAEVCADANEAEQTEAADEAEETEVPEEAGETEAAEEAEAGEEENRLISLFEGLFGAMEGAEE